MNHTQDPSRLSASFPEGVLVRSTSALYRCYGVGRVVKVRGDQAKVEFNPSVFMSPAYRSGNESVAAGAC
jgi:hypothetical protein